MMGSVQQCKLICSDKHKGSTQKEPMNVRGTSTKKRGWFTVVPCILRFLRVHSSFPLIIQSYQRWK